MNLKVVRWADICVGIPLIYLYLFWRWITGRRIRQHTGGTYKKILLIKFWGIGNIAMLLPAARALKEHFPDADIDILTLVDNHDLCRAVDFFKAVYTISTKTPGRFALTTQKALSLMRKREYDLVVDFEQFARFSAIICILTKGDRTIGFKTNGQHRHFFYANAVPYNNGMHMTQSFFSLVQQVGISNDSEIQSIKPVRFLTDRQQAATVKMLEAEYGLSAKTDIIIVMHITTSENFKLRRWPAKNFATLADMLIARGVGEWSIKIVFTGLAEERKIVASTMRLIDHKANVIDVSGRLDFFQFAGLIGLSDLVISADTAPIHLAAAMSIPAVGLYGPNTPLLYGPWGEADNLYFYKKLFCSPCITNYNAKIHKCADRNGDHAACMEKISINEVYQGITEKYFDARSTAQLKTLRQYCRQAETNQ